VVPDDQFGELAIESGPVIGAEVGGESGRVRILLIDEELGGVILFAMRREAYSRSSLATWGSFPGLAANSAYRMRRGSSSSVMAVY